MTYYTILIMESNCKEAYTHIWAKQWLILNVFSHANMLVICGHFKTLLLKNKMHLKIRYRKRISVNLWLCAYPNIYFLLYYFKVSTKRNHVNFFPISIHIYNFANWFFVNSKKSARQDIFFCSGLPQLFEP